MLAASGTKPVVARVTKIFRGLVPLLPVLLLCTMPGTSHSVTSAADSLLRLRSRQGLVGSPHHILAELAGGQRMDPSSRGAWACLLCHPSPPNDEPMTFWDERYTEGSRDLQSPNLCLSCHDGLLAQRFKVPTSCIGGQRQALPALPEKTYSAAARSHLFTMPDRHSPDSRFRNSSSLPIAKGEVRCTTCHDPHRAEASYMLRRPLEQGQLCLECHNIPGWAHGSHGQSIDSRDTGLREAACASCHLLHNPQPRQALLRAEESEVCLSCHDGSVDCDGEVASHKDLARVFEKPFRHPVGLWQGALIEEDGVLGFFAGSDQPSVVSCSSCHNPHAAGQPDDPGAFGELSGSLRGVAGVSPLGLSRPALSEAEICLKCHGFTADGPLVTHNPWDIGRDVSEDFSLANASSHPVLGPVSGNGSPSLKSDRGGRARGNLPTQAIGLQTLNCSDCHGNDDPSGPQGPHASNIPGMLRAEWDSNGQAGRSDPLCMMCHEEAVVLSTQSWRRHSLHADAGYSCAACHDPHGSPTMEGLLNLDRRPWIQPVNGEFLVERIDLHSGNCTLSCHGYVHQKAPW